MLPTIEELYESGDYCSPEEYAALMESTEENQEDIDDLPW